MLMNVELNEQEEVKLQVAFLINESIDEIDKGAELVKGEEFFAEMRKKYSE